MTKRIVERNIFHIQHYEILLLCTSDISKIDVAAFLSTTNMQILKTFLHETIVASVRTRKSCVTVRILYYDINKMCEKDVGCNLLIFK